MMADDSDHFFASVDRRDRSHEARHFEMVLHDILAALQTRLPMAKSPNEVQLTMRCRPSLASLFRISHPKDGKALFRQRLDLLGWSLWSFLQ
jgi:hypothetical protein